MHYREILLFTEEEGERKEGREERKEGRKWRKGGREEERSRGEGERGSHFSMLQLPKPDFQ